MTMVSNFELLSLSLQEFPKHFQTHILCVLNYNFLGLSNAFLIHAPGIKTKKEAWANRDQNPTIQLVANVILREIADTFGERKKCKMFA